MQTCRRRRPDEYYVFELVGLEVEEEGGRKLGVVHRRRPRPCQRRARARHRLSCSRSSRPASDRSTSTRRRILVAPGFRRLITNLLKPCASTSSRSSRTSSPGCLRAAAASPPSSAASSTCASSTTGTGRRSRRRRSTTSRTAAAPGMVLAGRRRRGGARRRLRRPARAPGGRADAAGPAARPGGRRRARRRGAPDPALGPVRGLRRAHPRSTSRPMRSRSALRPLRRRAARDGRCSTPSPGGFPARSSEGSGVRGELLRRLEGGLEYPHYTRPAEFRGWTVPDVLLSGDHARIADWRREQSRARTADRG